jgi:gliotoxin biosynthesis N-methyltransferase
MWVRDFQSSLPATPAHTFVGIDIDPSKFPQDPPAGTSYQVQDINKPWPEDWKNSFDFVHQRLAMVGAGPNGQGALKNLSELVKPGGWIQLIEAENVPEESDGPAMHDFVQVMKDIFVFVGAGLKLSHQMAEWLKADGFADMEERVFVCQMGATNPNPQLAKQGVFSMGVAATGLVTFAKSTLSRAILLLCSKPP